MRLGIVIAVSADRKTAEVVAGPAPYPQMDDKIKALKRAGDLVNGKPIVQLWTGNNGVVKSFTLKKPAQKAPAQESENKQPELPKKQPSGKK